jgi:hypothetical protein
MRRIAFITFTLFCLLTILLLYSSCVRDLPPEAELRDRIVGRWRFNGGTSVSEYRPDGTYVDSNWVHIRGVPKGFDVLVVHQARYRVVGHILYSTNDSFTVVDPPSKPFEIRSTIDPLDIQISGDSLQTMQVCIFTSQSFPEKPFQGRWSFEELVYLGPPITHPHYFCGKVRTTFDFSSESHQYRMYTEYPTRAGLPSKIDSGTFTYKPPFFWLNERPGGPMQVELVDGRMHVYRTPYVSTAHRVH